MFLKNNILNISISDLKLIEIEFNNDEKLSELILIEIIIVDSSKTKELINKDDKEYLLSLISFSLKKENISQTTLSEFRSQLSFKHF